METLNQFQQEHLLQYYDELSPEQQQTLTEEISNIDFELVNSVTNNQLYQKVYLQRQEQQNQQTDRIEPLRQVQQILNNPQAAIWKQRGIDLVREGQVAALVLAGGQGTRLGFEFPKGMYDIGMPSHKSIFQYLSEKLLRLQIISNTQIPIPFLIMSNQETKILIREYFERNDYFGLHPDQIFVFPQSMLPAVDFDGKIILDQKHKISLSPSGNGAVYHALKQSGALDLLQAIFREQKGIQYLHLFGVDNVLVKPADPVLIGYTDINNLELTSKAIVKNDPAEPVGVIALRNGNPDIIEYSELSEDLANAKDQQGRLLFRLGNICNHVYTTAFLKRIVTEHLEDLLKCYHLAIKKVPYIDQGQRTVPTTPNAAKFEIFIFDAMKFARTTGAIEINRFEEFAPVKNAPGSAQDSPDTARKLMNNLFIKWLKNAGANVSVISFTDINEISPLISLDGEGLSNYAGTTIKTPFYLYYQLIAKLQAIFKFDHLISWIKLKSYIKNCLFFRLFKSRTLLEN